MPKTYEKKWSHKDLENEPKMTMAQLIAMIIEQADLNERETEIAEYNFAGVENDGLTADQSRDRTNKDLELHPWELRDVMIKIEKAHNAIWHHPAHKLHIVRAY